MGLKNIIPEKLKKFISEARKSKCENQEYLIEICKKISLFINTIVLILVLAVSLEMPIILNIIISYIIAYWINRIFWDICTTWFYIDIIHGWMIYKEETKINKPYYRIITAIILYMKEPKKKYMYNKIQYVCSLIPKIIIYITLTLIEKYCNSIDMIYKKKLNKINFNTSYSVSQKKLINVLNNQTNKYICLFNIKKIITRKYQVKVNNIFKENLNIYTDNKIKLLNSMLTYIYLVINLCINMLVWNCNAFRILIKFSLALILLVLSSLIKKNLLLILSLKLNIKRNLLWQYICLTDYLKFKCSSVSTKLFFNYIDNIYINDKPIIFYILYQYLRFNLNTSLNKLKINMIIWLKKTHNKSIVCYNLYIPMQFNIHIKLNSLIKFLVKDIIFVSYNSFIKDKIIYVTSIYMKYYKLNSYKKILNKKYIAWICLSYYLNSKIGLHIIINNYTAVIYFIKQLNVIQIKLQDILGFIIVLLKLIIGIIISLKNQTIYNVQKYKSSLTVVLIKMIGDISTHIVFTYLLNFKDLYLSSNTQIKYFTINNLYLIIQNKLLYIIEVFNLNYSIINKYIHSIRFKYLFLEVKIYIANKKIPYKKLKNTAALYIIKYFDKLQYSILTKEKNFEHRNIEKYHKKNYNIKRIPSLFEKKIKLYKPIAKANLLLLFKFILTKLKIYINVIELIHIEYTKNIKTNSIRLFFVNNFILIIIKSTISSFSLIFHHKLAKIVLALKYILNLLFLFLARINTSPYYIFIINNAYIIIISPLLLIDFVLLDIYLTLLYFKLIGKNKRIRIKKLYKKLYKKLLQLMYLFCWSIKIIRIILKFIIKIITFLNSKLIYVVLFGCYFFNKHTSNVLYYELFDCRLFNYMSANKNLYEIGLFLNNKNSIYVLLTVLGILNMLRWAKRVHKVYGYFLWTLIIYPIFLESHKILYTKLLVINMFNIDTFEYLIAIKIGLLDLLNFKIYNAYHAVSILILIFIFIFAIRYEAFKGIYGNPKAQRWYFIKYPIIIILLEVFRFKIIQIIAVTMVYTCYSFDLYPLYMQTIVSINNSQLFCLIIYLIDNFLYNIERIDYYWVYMFLIPNFYVINFLIDLLMFFISYKWLFNYCKSFLNYDAKYVAFPVVMTELFFKYVSIYYVSYYLSIYVFIWINDGRLLWYGMQFSILWFIYLDFRVFKFPRKTMPWYFRQIVDLWPAAWANFHCDPKALYTDQFYYLTMRNKFASPKRDHQYYYYKLELWEKKLTLLHQEDKFNTIVSYTSFHRYMSRKENMLREFNVLNYQGWQSDWSYNCEKINTFSWKLDWWDKPHIYLFRKAFMLSNVKFYYFCYTKLVYRFASKYTHLNYLFFIASILDYFYTNNYIYTYNMSNDFRHRVLFKIGNYKKSCRVWSDIAAEKGEDYEYLEHLKKLKILLMDFSSGEQVKPYNWLFPPMFQERYKKEGWKMFQDPAIDNFCLDIRPNFIKW